MLHNGLCCGIVCAGSILFGFLVVELNKFLAVELKKLVFVVEILKTLGLFL